MQNEETIDLREIFSLLLSKIWFLIIITILGGAAAYGVSYFMLPVKYSSHITMYVQSYTGISENVNQVNNISNSKQLVNTYMVVLKDDAVLNAVGQKLMEQFDLDTLGNSFSIVRGAITPDSLRSSISVSSVTDTSAVNIVATTQDPVVSAAVCNALTSVAPDYVTNAVGVGSINTIDTAKVYKTPVSPNKTKNTAIGMFGAFAAAAMIIILIDFFDNTVKDSDALANRYKKAIIGEVQQYDQGGKKKKKKQKKDQDQDDHMKLTDSNVPFYIVESYKSIRTNVSFALSTVEKKIFAVSSANPGEGKSTTSANMAIAIAQSGSKILLIDADMRKSVQHKIFGLTNKKGLSTAISKMSKLEECIQRNVMDNLDILPAGPVPPNPSELLASDNMTALLKQLSQEYDVILIDTPPVNVVTDAMELAKNISGIVMVLRYGITSVEDADIAFKKIEFAQMNLLGFILNGIHTKKAGYYSKYKKGRYYNKYYYKKGYGYGYGYGYYGSKPEEPADNAAEQKTAETNSIQTAETKTADIPNVADNTNNNTNDNNSTNNNNNNNSSNKKGKKGRK